MCTTIVGLRHTKILRFMNGYSIKRNLNYKKIDLETAVLNDYIGSYDYNLKEQEGVLEIVVEDNKLIAVFKTRKNTVKCILKR